MNAIYAGSFDPFTNGHMEVLRQAVPLFDKITVLFAENPAKITRFNCNPIMWSLRQMMPDVDFELQVPGTMLTDEMKRLGCEYLIRGLRGTSDYLYEETLFQSYRLLKPDCKVVYFNSGTVISSTMVYELWRRDKDVSGYIPYSPDMLVPALKDRQ